MFLQPAYMPAVGSDWFSTVRFSSWVLDVIVLLICLQGALVHKGCSKRVPAETRHCCCGGRALAGDAETSGCPVWITARGWVIRAFEHHWFWLYYMKNICENHGQEKRSCVIVTRFSPCSAMSAWWRETGCGSCCRCVCAGTRARM